MSVQTLFHCWTCTWSDVIYHPSCDAKLNEAEHLWKKLAYDYVTGNEGMPTPPLSCYWGRTFLNTPLPMQSHLRVSNPEMQQWSYSVGSLHQHYQASQRQKSWEQLCRTCSRCLHTSGFGSMWMGCGVYRSISPYGVAASFTTFHVYKGTKKFYTISINFLHFLTFYSMALEP